MSTPEERDVERRRSAERALRRETTVRRAKDIVWAAVIASGITIVVVLSLGWLTTQAVVERMEARSLLAASWRGGERPAEQKAVRTSFRVPGAAPSGGW